MLDHECRLDSHYSSAIKLNLRMTLALRFIVYAMALLPECAAQVLLRRRYFHIGYNERQSRR